METLTRRASLGSGEIDETLGRFDNLSAVDLPSTFWKAGKCSRPPRSSP
jgi:hypothetical protein